VFFSERLRPDHDLSAFSSGKDALDRWLRDHAVHADRTGSGRTYVWLDESGAVVAFFTLAPHLVRREETAPAVARGAPDVIPSILLARLALDRSLHRKGHGAALLADALAVALDAMRRAGGRLIVVDAIDAAAAAFYERHGFVPVPGNPYRLVIKASVAARSLSLPWP
jgi:GNAT superfamily N-acetyltransferase